MLLIFLLYPLHPISSLGQSLPLILNCRHLPIIVFHSTCKAVLPCLFYHSDHRFLHSTVFFLLFFSICFTSYFKLCRNEIPPHQRQRADFFPCTVDATTFEAKCKSVERIAKIFLKYADRVRALASSKVWERMEVKVFRGSPDWKTLSF